MMRTVEIIAAVISGLFLAAVSVWIIAQGIKDIREVLRDIREQKEKAD